MDNANLIAELQDYKKRYQTAVDALQHQELVIRRLEDLLSSKVQPKPLLVDATTSTSHDLVDANGDPFAAGNYLVMQNTQLRLSLTRAEEIIRSRQLNFEKVLREKNEQIIAMKKQEGGAKQGLGQKMGSVAAASQFAAQISRPGSSASHAAPAQPSPAKPGGQVSFKADPTPVEGSNAGSQVGKKTAGSSPGSSAVVVSPYQAAGGLTANGPYNIPQSGTSPMHRVGSTYSAGGPQQAGPSPVHRVGSTYSTGSHIAGSSHGGSYLGDRPSTGGSGISAVSAGTNVKVVKKTESKKGPRMTFED